MKLRYLLLPLLLVASSTAVVAAESKEASKADQQGALEECQNKAKKDANGNVKEEDVAACMKRKGINYDSAAISR